MSLLDSITVLLRKDEGQREPSASTTEAIQSYLSIVERTRHRSHELLRYTIWAIPILGFLGTVVGISDAVGELSRMTGSDSKGEAIAQNLRRVMLPLAVAFDTTVLSLSMALILVLLQTMLVRIELKTLHRVELFVLAELQRRLHEELGPDPGETV